ncbi:hypothetical protein [Lacinutrix sp. MEBiC02595]
MKTLKNQLPRTVLVLLLITALFSSCSSDDDSNEPDTPELEALELVDCSTGIADGETRTLVNRNSGVDYIVNCTYVVYGDLVIEPGVTIQFGTDATIRVYSSGSIQALGTAQDQVVFTGEDKIAGSWRGLYIVSGDVKNKIEHSIIEYAGAVGDYGALVLWSDTHLEMNNTTISNSQTYGLHADTGNNELVLENNTITSCKAPMYILGTYITTISGGNYIGNDTDAIIANRDYIANESHHIWTKLNVPYHFPEGMDVTNSGGKLTIMPGVVMKFGQDTDLAITEGAGGNKPSLIAVGTAADPIVFTSIDNTLSSWRGIYFDSPSTLNEIGFATIENASNSNQTGAIYLWAYSVLNVHDVLFKDITNCSIQTFTNDGIVLTTSNLSYDNVGSEICVD